MRRRPVSAAVFSFWLLGALGVLAGGCANSVLRNAVEAVIESDATVVDAAAPVLGDRAVVAADHILASEVGIDIFRQGGNVVDAAVATSFAVCVVNPSSCGIGGGGFMLIYLAADQKAVALDYRETAPAAATRDMYVRDGKADPALSRSGGTAVAVPGEVAGLTLVQQRYGSLPLATLLKGAIELASNGFPVGSHLAGTIAQNVEAIRRNPVLARSFLNEDGTPLAVGSTLRRPDLAATLRSIADEGAHVFYNGRIAERIVAAAQASGGVITRRDLQNYKPAWRTPLEGDYRGDRLLTMPPPSSAAVLLETFGMLRNDDLPLLGWGSGTYSHLLAESMKHGFADRAHFLGDPLGGKSPVPALLTSANLDALRQRIDPAHVLAVDAYGSEPGRVVAATDDGGTSHLSVIDAQGNAVACTTTINTAFGALIASEDGVILNNEMDDFSAQPGVPNVFGLVGAEANAIAPGKRPLSSMSPTIVVRDGKAILAVGGSGGPLILSGTIQVLANAITFGQDARAAVTAPRLHHQWMPSTLAVEKGYPAAAIAGLRERGHEVKEIPTMGAVQLVQRRAGRLEGWSDPRKGGEAAAW